MGAAVTSVKISALTAAGTLVGTETVPVVQNGVTVRAQVNDLLTYANINISQTVATLAALKALTTRPEAVIVETGQAAGVWQWALASTTTADDALVVTPTSGTAGRYKRIYDGDINALWFGCARDGTTDDATPLQAAITASTTLARGLYIPYGTYIVGTKLTSVTGLSMYGDGWDTILKEKSSTNLTAILEIGGEASQSSGQIKDICFDGNKSNNASGGVGLSIVRGYKLNLFNVRVTAAKSHGIQYSGTATSFENYINNCNSYANDGWGVFFVGAVSDTHVVGCDIGFNTLGGVRLAGACSVRGGTVWGGSITTSVGIGTAGTSFQLFGVTIEGHGLYGVQVSAGNLLAHIQGCKIYANSWSASTDGLYDGVYVEAGSGGGSLIGNKIFSAISASAPYSTRYALNFAGAHDTWTIAGNDMTWLVAANPPTQKTGAIVNGILETDKADFNWIRTNLKLRLSANVNPASAATWVSFPLNTEDSTDLLSEYDTSTYAFVPKNTGRYQFIVNMLTTPNATGQYMGLSLYTTAGVEVRRVAYALSNTTNTQGVFAMIEEFLTAGTSYDIRYFHTSTLSTVVAGAGFTYAKIRAVPS